MKKSPTEKLNKQYFGLAITGFAIFSGLLLLARPWTALMQEAASLPSDFDRAVQDGQRSLGSDQSTRDRQNVIKGAEYKTAWDDSGLDLLVDGEQPAANVTEQIQTEINNDASIRQKFAAEEADYLSTNNISPAEIENVEGKIDEVYKAEGQSSDNPADATSPSDSAALQPVAPEEYPTAPPSEEPSSEPTPSADNVAPAPAPESPPPPSGSDN